MERGIDRVCVCMCVGGGENPCSGQVIIVYPSIHILVSREVSCSLGGTALMPQGLGLDFHPSPGNQSCIYQECLTVTHCNSVVGFIICTYHNLL